ncbi:MAG: CDP-diacylglycerol--glycerol-3-phosphate 3-phosphatidyltransferase [Candidatus Saccharibacteria bacterium]|nr:CDP-diacylglycerol--glycerol-3-phosphate 3-phosphatidyltransferase [Candidatus Saccharibacteria bacterium]
MTTKKSTKTNLINGPTILTLARIVLVLPLMICFFVNNLPGQIATLLCFVVASITDFIDGRWARSKKIVTDLGAFLDPLADKMLVNLTFLMLTYVGIVPLWMFAIILVRDFAVDGMRMMAAKSGITVSASIFGKAKTMLQMITLTSILFNRMLNCEILTNINFALLIAVVALTIFSGSDYLIDGYKKLIKPKD